MPGHQASPEHSINKLETTRSQRLADQPRRKRASKACLGCRRRKVRCNVAQRGPPCMNCFLDKEDCVVKPRPTNYRVDKRGLVSQAPQVRRTDSANMSSKQSQVNSGDSPAAQGSSLIQEMIMGDVGARVEADEMMDHEFHDHSGGGHGRRMLRALETSSSAANLPNGFGEYTSASLFQNTPAVVDFESQSVLNTHIMYSYYSFLKSGSVSRIAPQDVKFLEAQGCFRIPMRPMLDEFVREYFLHVHPILPIINEKTFWKMYEDHDSGTQGTSRISLFVFQSMLFASSSFVSAPIIQKLGYASNRSARASYFRRAKLLFEFDGEEDQLSMAQGTLLMSYHSPMRSHPKANTYWLGIAIQLAKQAEAHRYQTKREITHEQRNILKRLWWCCILRDRILPLGVRKSIQISALDFDFHTQTPLLLSDFESEIEASRVYDVITKRALIQRLVALSELAITLTEVIVILYPEKEAFPQQGQKDPSSAVRACKLELHTWFEKTTVICLTTPGLSEMHESVLLYTNLMYIYYHSALLALCNHEVLLATTGWSSGGAGSNGLAQIHDTRHQIDDAINGVSVNLKELVQLKLAKYMPISVVAYVALPLVLHLLDVKLSNTSFRTTKQRRLNIYTEAMKVLRSQYDVTNTVSQIIGKLVEHISLEEQETQGETPGNRSEADLGSLASKSTDDPSAVNNWGDILLRQPKLYLRLASTIDLSMSKGGFLRDSDFPLALQSKTKPETHCPPYKISLDITKVPGYPHDGLSSTRGFDGCLSGGSEVVSDPAMTASLDRPLGITPNEMMTQVIMGDAMNFDPSGFELPLGFEAFNMELSSKRGFDFDFPWGDNTPFPESI